MATFDETARQACKVSGVGLTLWLDRSPHHAERHEQLSILEHHRGDDSVKRPLAWFEAVDVAGLEHEACSSIVQHDSGIAGYDTRTKALKQAVDKRYRVAILIYHGEVGRVAVAGGDSFAEEVGMSVMVILEMDGDPDALLAAAAELEARRPTSAVTARVTEGRLPALSARTRSRAERTGRRRAVARRTHRPPTGEACGQL